MKRKSGELLKRGKTHGSASTDRCDFCCGKTAAATLFVGLLQLFVCFSLPPPQDCPEKYAASQLNIALLMLFGNPVGIRNNRPLLCLSQRACGINWVYHALTGECSLVCPYLRANGLHSFYLRENHKTVREGCK